MHENAIKKNVWQSGKVVTHKECVFTKSAFRCTMTTTEGKGEEEQTDMKRK